jgi:predicted DCC family thiol-disulfide oxidoreductase YuxK
MIRVFYDGSCGLCSKEIAYYMKIAPMGRFEWIDLAKTPDAFTQLGYSLIEGFRLMHVQDDLGNMAVAVDAFAVLWRGLGGFWKIPATLIKWPVIYSLTSLAYRAFAKRRFNKSQKTCRLG